MTAHWRRGRIGIELVADGETAVLVARNGSEWRAWGDVQYSHRDREKVIERVLESYREAGVRVTNRVPEDS